MIDSNIVDQLSALLQEGNSYILKELLTVLRVLILDDDVRVEFGRAHEHARIIAVETLTHINELLKSMFQCEKCIEELSYSILKLSNHAVLILRL